jgi:hypothetical protein
VAAKHLRGENLMGSQDQHREYVVSVPAPGAEDWHMAEPPQTLVSYSEIPGVGCDYARGTNTPGDQGLEQGEANLNYRGPSKRGDDDNLMNYG